MKRVDVFEVCLGDGIATVAGEDAGYYRARGALRFSPHIFKGSALFTIEADAPQRQLMQDALNKLVAMGYRIVSTNGTGLGSVYFVVAEPVAQPTPPVGEAMSDD